MSGPNITQIKHVKDLFSCLKYSYLKYEYKMDTYLLSTRGEN